MQIPDSLGICRICFSPVYTYQQNVIINNYYFHKKCSGRVKEVKPRPFIKGE